MKALVLNGEVVQVEKKEFSVHPSLSWIQIPDGIPVRAGWLYNGCEFLSPPPQTPGTGGKGGSAIGGGLNIGGQGGGGCIGGAGGDALEGNINIGGAGGHGQNVIPNKSDINWNAVGAIAAMVTIVLAVLGFFL